MSQPTAFRIQASTVAEVVAGHYGFSLLRLQSQSRARRLAHARFIAIYAIRELCPHMSYPMIGRLLGGRDHTSVIYAAKRAEALLLDETHAAILRQVYVDLGSRTVDAQLKLARARVRELNQMKKKLTLDQQVAA